MAITYLGNTETADEFTLGSNLSAVVNGQSGQDVVRITQHQTATVNATSDADQTILFGAGVKIDSVASNILGTKIVFTNDDNTTTTVNANAANTFQIGNAEYTAAEFVELFNITNGANQYTVGSNAAYEAAFESTSSLFTLTVDTADKTYADEDNAMGKITATVAETTADTSAKDVAVTFSTSTAFANNVISIDAEGTSGFYTMAGDPTVLIAEKATLEAAGITAASDEIVGTVGVGDATTMAVTFTHDNANIALINAFLTDVNIGNPANAVDATLTIKLTDADGAVATDTVAIEVAADDAYNDITVTNFTTLLDSREVESSDIDAGPVKIDDGADFTLTLGDNLETVGNALVEDTIVTITGARANDTLGFSNGDDETGAANTARFLGTDVYLNVAGTETLVGSVASIPVAGGDMVLTINEGVSLVNANLLLKDLAITLENTSISTPQDVVALSVTIDSQSAAEAVVTPVNLTVVEDFTDITLADLVARTTGETNIDDSDTMEGNYNITVVNGDSGQDYDLTDLVITDIGTVRILVTDSADLTDANLDAFGDNISYYKVTDTKTLTTTAALLDGISVRGDNGPANVTVEINDLDLTLDADFSGIAESITTGSNSVTANFSTTPAGDAPFTGDLGYVTVAVADGVTMTIAAADANGKTIDAAGTGAIAVTDLNSAELDLAGITTNTAANNTITNAIDATLHEDTNLGTLQLTIANNTTVTANADQVTAKVVAGTGDIVINNLEDTPALSIDSFTATGSVTVNVTDDTIFTGDIMPTDANATDADVVVATAAKLTVDANKITALTVTGEGDVCVTALGATEADLSNIANSGSKIVEVPVSNTIHLDSDLGNFTVSVTHTAVAAVDAAQVSGLTVVASDSDTLTVTAENAESGNNDEVMTFNLNVAGTVHAVSVDLTTADIETASEVTAAIKTAIDALEIANISVKDTGAAITVSSTTGDVSFDTVEVEGTVGELTATTTDTMTITGDTTDAGATDDEGMTFNLNVDGTDYAVTADFSAINATSAAAIDDVVLAALDAMIAANATLTAMDLVTATGAGTVTVTSALHDATFNSIVATGTVDGLAGADTTTGSSVTIKNIDESLAANLSGISSVNNEGTLNIVVDEDTALSSSADLGDFQATVSNTKTLTLTTAQANGMTIVDDNNDGATIVTGLGSTEVDLSTITTTTNVAQISSAATLNASTDLGTFNIEMTTDTADLTISAAQADNVQFDAGTTEATVTITASAGDQTLYGTDNADIIDAGAGSDIIYASGGIDTITTGTNDSDTIVYVSAGDSSTGPDNMDVITDFYYGGLGGGDQIDLSKLATIYNNDDAATSAFLGTGSFGDTTVVNDADNMEIRYTALTGESVVEIDIDGNGSTDMQILVQGATTLVSADFVLTGGDIAGNDTATAYAGATMSMGGGDDVVRATAAQLVATTIDAGADTDDLLIVGGGTLDMADIGGADAVTAFESLTLEEATTLTLDDTETTMTTINGSTGNDIIDMDDESTATTVNAGAGDDTITVSTAAAAAHILSGEAGNDTFIIADAYADTVAGTKIYGGDATADAGTDTLDINELKADSTVDLTGATISGIEVLDLDVTTTSTIVSLNITGEQLNGFDTITAADDDEINVSVLDGLTVASTDAIDNFILLNDDEAVVINDFETGVDKVQMTTGFTITSAADGTTPDTTDTLLYYFTSAVAGDADSAGAVADKATLDGTFTAANGVVAYILMTDDDSSAIYKWTEGSVAEDEVLSTELTLMGTFDSAIAYTDLTIA